MVKEAPIIMEITARKVLKEICRKAHFYVPEWTPGVEGDFGNALSRIFAEMAEDIASNLNHAPQKHLLSFFNMLNFSPRPAQPARTVFCFVLDSEVQENVTIPEKTYITAEGPEGEDIFFETEKAIEVTSSKLCFVCSLNPQGERILDHSSIINGNKPSTLFSDSSENSKENLQEHIFYIGDEKLFSTGKGKISLTLETVGSVPVTVLADKDYFSWEYAGSKSGNEKEETEITEWIPFLEVELSENSSEEHVIPKIILKAENNIGIGKINDLKSRWIRCLLKNAKISELEQFCLGSFKVNISAEGATPDTLFYNDIPLEEKEEGIQPFGSKPFINDTFYIACSEVFGRQGSEVRLDFDLIPGRASQLSEKPELSWEYWNGESWLSLKKLMDFRLDSGESLESKKESEEKVPDLELENFLECYINGEESENESNAIAKFLIPKEKKDDKNPPPLVNVSVIIRKMPPMKPGNVNGVEDYWIRVRLIGGNFGKEYVISISKKNEIKPGKFYPPKIKNLRLGYCYKEGREPESLVSKNNRAFEDKKKDLEMAGSFKPFKMIPESHSAIYFGFTSKLVKGPLSLFFELKETSKDNKSPVKYKWQYLSTEESWKELQVLDETRGLAKSGILEFFVPEEMINLDLYGSKNPLYWIRLQFIKDKETPLRTPLVSGVYTNCVWALQAKTIEDEILVSVSKETEHEFELMNRPVVDAKVWVNEVSWLPEREKISLLRDRSVDIEAIKDDKCRFSEFWVRWEKVEDFSDSDGGSRHYLLDKVSGKINFGNGIRGMAPPIGVNNIKATYRIGGGETGNMEAYSITKLYSDLKHINAVYNPIASEGGSGTESVNEMVERAPAKFKHRDRAVTGEDIVYLAREAHEKIAKVKVLSGLDEEENSVPGLITVVIVPDIPGTSPAPTNEIRQIVEAYLEKRSPNTATLKIVGPIYYEVNVDVSLVSTHLETLSKIEKKVKTNIEDFLHPLRGGKKGMGWHFGQAPSESDFYSLISHIEGVSYVKNIRITFTPKSETSEKSPEYLECNSFSDLPLPVNGKSALPSSGKHNIDVF